MSESPSTPPPSRSERRAAERGARFDVGARGTTRPSGRRAAQPRRLLTTRNLTFGGARRRRAPRRCARLQPARRPGGYGDLRDPGLAYPTAILDGNALGSAPRAGHAGGLGGLPVPGLRPPLARRGARAGQPVVLAGHLRIVHHEIDILGRGGRGSPGCPRSGRSAHDQQDAYWSYAHWIYANQDGENRAASGAIGSSRSRRPPGSTRAAFDDLSRHARGGGRRSMRPRPWAPSLASTSTPTIFLNGTRYAASRAAGLGDADRGGAREGERVAGGLSPCRDPQPPAASGSSAP